MRGNHLQKRRIRNPWIGAVAIVMTRKPLLVVPAAAECLDRMLEAGVLSSLGVVKALWGRRYLVSRPACTAMGTKSLVITS